MVSEKGIPAASRRRLAKIWLKKQAKLSAEDKQELAKRKIDGPENFEHEKNVLIYQASDVRGNSIFVRLNRQKDLRIELALFFTLSSGDTYELPDHPNIVLDKISTNVWCAGDLKLSILEKSRRARIIYNGFMRKGTRNDVTNQAEDGIEHVKLNFLFIAETVPRLKDDYWNFNLKAKTLANVSWKGSEWQEFWNGIKTDSVDQWGSMLGQIFIEQAPALEVFLHGIRSSEWSNVDNNECFKKSIWITGFGSKGLNFHINLNDLGNEFRDIQMGHIKDGCDKFSNIKKMVIDNQGAFDLENVEQNKCAIKFRVRKREFEIAMKLNKENRRSLMGGDPWNSKYSFCSFDFNLFNSKGKGLLYMWEPFNGTSPSLFNQETVKESTDAKESEVSPLVNNTPSIFTIPLEDKDCQKEELVGGKGCSLAKIMALKSDQYKIPKGFCITVNALKEQINLNRKLAINIEKLVDICAERKAGDIKSACEKLTNLFEETPVNEEVKMAITVATKNFEFTHFERKITYAIRSSAIGEDCEDYSAAGVNATYLGISDLNEIVKCVAKCWASLFSYRSVEYRRQQGQPINIDMGVCIQEMVEAESAGVMFTRHPLSGNPGEIYITSNYGLGESVVSALVEPDTIVIERTWGGSLEVKQVTVGAKTEKIEVSENGGINISKLSKSEKKKLSITNDEALRLAKIGLEVEKHLGGPRDVEWAIIDDDVYLFQCRPITTFNNMTEFELMHELGGGCGNDIDTYTFANVGEVFPYPNSPLNLSSVVKCFNACTEFGLTHVVNLETYTWYFFVTHMRLSMNYSNGILRFISKEITLFNKCADIVLAGHEICNDDLFQLALERHGPMSYGKSLKLTRNLARYVWSNDRRIEKMKELIEICWDKFSSSKLLSTKDMYNHISELFLDVFKACLYHATTSNISGIGQMIAFSTLMEGEKDITPDHLRDMSNILKSYSDVVSAGAPAAIRSIALAIKNSGLKDEFLGLESAKMRWLRVNCPKACKEVQEFFKEYGHRAIMELDVMTETWSMNPDKFLTTIQLMLKNGARDEEPESKTPVETDLNVADQLVTPKKMSTRWLLKKMVPICHRAVARREMSKNLLIEMVHVLRLHYKNLEALMIKDGLLPDEGLIFFLTHEEIGTVIGKSNSSLIRKAVQRRKLHTKLMSLKFKDMNIGMPKPIFEKVDIIYDPNAPIVKGSPAYDGVVTGRACVILDLEETDKILNGDILITKATDIGWSPYFPMLLGIVTELGGLMSHGAVVAREYGLPSVIGATNATQIFKTGDLVILDGNVGELRLAERNLSNGTKFENSNSVQENED